jgi:hypothetical protein
VKSIEALMSTCPEGDDADFFELPHWSEITAMTDDDDDNTEAAKRDSLRLSIFDRLRNGMPATRTGHGLSDTFCLQAGHGIIGMSLALHSQFTRADLYIRDVFPFI